MELNKNLALLVVSVLAWFAMLFATIVVTHEDESDSLPLCATQDAVPKSGSCIWNGGKNGKGHTLINHSDGTYTVIPRGER